MRILAALLLSVIFLTGCASEEERARRDLERAEEQLAEARERVAEMRDDAQDDIERAQRAIRDAREAMGDVNEEWSRDARGQAREAFDDIGIGETIGAVFEEVGRAMQGESDVEPVSARSLLELLPEEVAGFDRYNTNRDDTRALGIHLAHVTGSYDGPDGADMTIAIVDLGSLHGAASKAFAKMNLHVDRASGTHTERTTEFDGYPGHIKTHMHRGKTEIQATVFVDDRFLVHVQADGREVDARLIERVLDAIGLRRLERLG